MESVKSVFKSLIITTVILLGFGNVGTQAAEVVEPVIIEMNRVSINIEKEYVYTGTEIRPEPTVTYQGEQLKKDVDYTVSYEDNINTGQASCIIDGTGDYMEGGYVGFQEVTYIIKPLKAKLSGVKSKSPGTLTVKWKKDKQAQFYQIQIAKDKNFKKGKKNYIVDQDHSNNIKLPRLKRNTKYYVRIRSGISIGNWIETNGITKYNEKKIYGEWSTRQNCKTKNYKINSFEKQVVTLVNKERKKKGLKSLKINWELSKAARLKSKDMWKNKYFSHQSPKYGSPFQMMSKFEIEYTMAAENIACGQRTPQTVVKGWMNSPGHRANILNKSLTEIGVGYSANKGIPYWTQMFIRP